MFLQGQLGLIQLFLQLMGALFQLTESLAMLGSAGSLCLQLSLHGLQLLRGDVDDDRATHSPLGDLLTTSAHCSLGREGRVIFSHKFFGG